MLKPNKQLSGNEKLSFSAIVYKCKLDSLSDNMIDFECLNERFQVCEWVCDLCIQYAHEEQHFNAYSNATAIISGFIALLTNNTGSDRNYRTVIGRSCHVISPIWSRIDWLAGPKIRIIGLSFANLLRGLTIKSY